MAVRRGPSVGSTSVPWWKRWGRTVVLLVCVGSFDSGAAVAAPPLRMTMSVRCFEF